MSQSIENFYTQQAESLQNNMSSHIREWKQKLSSSDTILPIGKFELVFHSDPLDKIMQVYPSVFASVIGKDSILYDEDLLNESSRYVPRFSLPEVMSEYVTFNSAKVFFSCLYEDRYPTLIELHNLSTYSSVDFHDLLVGLIELCKYFSIQHHYDFYRSLFLSIKWQSKYEEDNKYILKQLK